MYAQHAIDHVTERLTRRTVFTAILLSTLFPLPATAQALSPQPTVVDVGAPAIPGYASYANQAYTVSGAGKGITGRTDQFTFVYWALTGDGAIVARVPNLTNATANAQVGLMLRETLDAGSRHAAFLISKANEVMFKRRAAADRSTSTLKIAPRSTPVFLKLERKAAMIIASLSNDGSTWTTFYSGNLGMGGAIYAGLAVTSNTEVAATRATFRNATVTSLAETGGPLPEDWTSQDIGSPTHSGIATYSTGTFAVLGGGAEINNAWDEFHYAYLPVDGDVDIIARLRAIGNQYAKAGVMVRDGLTPNGAHASMLYMGVKGTTFQRRPVPGASTVRTAWRGAPAPVWMKLSVRNGEVTGYYSRDGITWTLSGTETLTLPSPFYVGLAVTSRDDRATVTTNFDTVRVQFVGQSQNEDPRVTLTAPASGASFTTPATITLSADASDSDGTVTRVDFYDGATLIGSDTTSPYSLPWHTVAAGTYSLSAVATDDDGASVTSSVHVVTLKEPANLPPSVSLTAPASGASITAPATVSINASASDADGTITRVDFYAGATLLGSDTTAPYTVTWSGVAPGSYWLTARALDDAGATTVSSGRSVTVAAAPPTTAASTTRRAVFAASLDHDTVVTSYVLEIFAPGANPSTATPIASRNLGKPAVVNGECTADVSATLNALAPGNYQVTVAAVAAMGRSRSAPIPFTR